MSSWIDDLKEQDEQQKKAIANFNAIRLHNAVVVHAKAPGLWTLLIAQIEADLMQLSEIFPNDLGRQCELIKRSHSYILQGRKLPFTILKLVLNLDAGCVCISKGYKQDFADRPVLMPLKPIDFKVTQDEDVIFFWRDREYIDPSALSEQFVRMVCGIH
jgi:hypothetical protein